MPFLGAGQTPASASTSTLPHQDPLPALTGQEKWGESPGARRAWRQWPQCGGDWICWKQGLHCDHIKRWHAAFERHSVAVVQLGCSALPSERTNAPRLAPMRRLFQEQVMPASSPCIPVSLCNRSLWTHYDIINHTAQSERAPRQSGC